MIQTVTINTLVPIIFTQASAAMPQPADTTLLKDGVVYTTVPLVFSEIGNGIYKFTFTPTETGLYNIVAGNKVIATISAVGRDMYSYLKNLEDEAIGSWLWDKNAGTLAMLRQDGTSLANFTVVDNLTTSSRERT